MQQRAGSYGVFLGWTPPHILCCSCSLRYLDNSIWCIFPEFSRCWNHHQMEEMNCLMTMSLQTFWHLRTDHHQPIRELSQLITDPGMPLPHVAFKNILRKSLGVFMVFFEHKPPILFAWSCSKHFSAPNSNILVCLTCLRIGHMNRSLVTLGNILITSHNSGNQTWSLCKVKAVYCLLWF